LKSFIQQQMPQGSIVMQTDGGDDGASNVAAMGTELQYVSELGMGGAATKAIAHGASELTQQSVEERKELIDEQQAADADVIVCASGNLAHVYFDFLPRKIVLSELDAAYPGLVQALVDHEGIGFVVVHADNGAPLVLGKQGQRNLVTGEIRGEDPLLPYAMGSTPPENKRSHGAGMVGQAPVEVRAWQVRRMAEFPSAGDVILNSTLYPDGTVAAFEELIGNHGGLGGEQTDSFIMHPASIEIPKTRNSTDFFAILSARRGLPAMPRPEPARSSEVDPWSFQLLWHGVADPSAWLGRAVRATFLDRTAFREVLNDPYSTGPALLIGLGAQLLLSLVREGRFDLWNVALTSALWLVAILALWVVGKPLGGQATFTGMLRAIGFAASANYIVLLGVFAVIRPLTSLAALMVSILAVWLGAAEAHGLRGWRTVVFPLVMIVVTIVGLAATDVVMGGATLTLQAMAHSLGLAP
jgi:hypothetical protein